MESQGDNELGKVGDDDGDNDDDDDNDNNNSNHNNDGDGRNADWFVSRQRPPRSSFPIVEENQYQPLVGNDQTKSK